MGAFQILTALTQHCVSIILQDTACLERKYCRIGESTSKKVYNVCVTSKKKDFRLK